MNAVILCPLGDRDFAATPAFLLTSLNIPCSLLQGMFDSRELFDSYIRSLTLVRLWRTVVSMDWDGECVRYSSSTKRIGMTKKHNWPGEMVIFFNQEQDPGMKFK